MKNILEEQQNKIIKKYCKENNKELTVLNDGYCKDTNTVKINSIKILYNTDGNVISRKDLDITFNYIYDNNSRLEKITDSNSNIIKSFKYDNNGNILEMIDRTNPLYNKIEYVYNKDNTISEQIFYIDKAKLINIISINNDKEIISESSILNEYIPLILKQYKYEKIDNRKCILVKTYEQFNYENPTIDTIDFEKSTQCELYKYSNDLLLSYQFLTRDNDIITTEYHYNKDNLIESISENGIIITEVIYNEYGLIIKEMYEDNTFKTKYIIEGEM